MEGQSSVTGSIVDELHFTDIQQDKIAGESGVTQSIIDELHSSDILRDEMEGESGFTRSIIETFFLGYARRSNRR